MRLLEYMDGQGLEVRDGNGYTALLLAVIGSHEELVVHLLRHGAQVNTKTILGTSALVIALAYRYLGVVMVLVDHMGPETPHDDLHWRDASGRTLLQRAVEVQDEAMVAYLLSIGFRPEVEDKYGTTALVCAAKSPCIRVLQMLLKYMGGQRLNEKEKTRRGQMGWTALHYAVRHNLPENVRALLLAGADPTIVDIYGRTPRGLAAEALFRGDSKCMAVFKVSTRITNMLIQECRAHE
jgi:ankyrin repeat protein